MNWKSLRSCVGLVLTNIVLAASGCEPQAATSPDQPVANAPLVNAAKPARKTITLSTTQPGQIEAFEQTPLFAKIAGYVEELKVDIGDVVKKDQLLLRLSVPELHDDAQQRTALVTQAAAEVDQAAANILATRAAAETAESRIAEVEAAVGRAAAEQQKWDSEYKRIQELAAKGSVTQKLEEETLSGLRAAEAAHSEALAKVQTARTSFREAEANVAKSQADKAAAEARLLVAQADLSRANTMLGYTEIKAPYDGTVTRRMIDTGHFVYPATGSASQPLLVVARTDVVRIFVDVPELEAAHVTPGDPVKIRVQAAGTREFDAEVIRTSWTLLESNHSLRVEVDIPNPDGVLRPGMYATVTIQLAQRVDVLTLPVSAVIRDGADAFCMSVVEGRIVRQPIELGLRSGGDIEVVSGLDTDPWVVMAKPETLHEGQEVQVAQPVN